MNGFLLYMREYLYMYYVYYVDLKTNFDTATCNTITDSPE